MFFSTPCQSTETSQILSAASGFIRGHPYIVPVMGLVYDAENGALGLVCERMKHDVATWRARKDVRAFADAMITAARGLAFLHSKGVVHGNLSPAAVFVAARSGFIGGFGLASVVAGGVEAVSLAYAAPEVLLGGVNQATPASDAYSFALMVYQVVGRLGDLPSAADREGREAALPWESTWCPEPDGWWADLLRRGMSPTPGNRPPVSDWVPVLDGMRATNKFACSRFLCLCTMGRWDEAMACSPGQDTDGVLVDQHGYSALHHVARSETAPLEMVAKCLELGIEVDWILEARPRRGTALAHACSEEKAAELVAVHADINATDEEDTTVLMHAVSSGSEAAIRFLVGAGADCGAVDARRKSAVDLRYARDLSEGLFLLLFQAGAVPTDTGAVLARAQARGHGRVVAWLEGGGAGG